MRARPMLLEIGVGLGSDVANGQSGGIACDDRAGTAMLGNASQEFALDLEILGDDFDDPVGLGAPGQIVLEVADGDEGRGAGSEERSGPRFQGSIEPGANNAVAEPR